MIDVPRLQAVAPPIWAGDTAVVSAACLLLGAAAVVCLVGFARDFLRARVARGALASRTTLRPGPMTLAGTVEASGDEPVALVRIDQQGKVQSRVAGVRCAWTEVRRQTSARPFSLVLARSGERVRVLADTRAVLIAPLEIGRAKEVSEQTLKRRKEAKLVHGEEVVITGILASEADPDGDGDGRGASKLVLTSAPGARLILAAPRIATALSTRGKFYGGMLAAVAVSALVLYSVLIEPYLRFRREGVTVMAQVTDVSTREIAPRPTSNTLTSATYEHTVRARIAPDVVRESVEPPGEPEPFKAFEATFLGGAAPVTVGDLVPFSYVPSDSSVYHYGYRLLLGGGRIAFTLVWAFLSLLATAFFWRTTRPWHTQAKLVEVDTTPPSQID